MPLKREERRVQDCFVILIERQRVVRAQSLKPDPNSPVSKQIKREERETEREKEKDASLKFNSTREH